MATLTVSAQFKFISEYALDVNGNKVRIHDSNQVFDHLVHVEWVSGSREGQQGWLLCSHYCQWPENLLVMADFIEGCYTPKGFENDPRLALGYHPSNVTGWCEETLTLRTNITVPGEDDDTIDLDWDMPELTTFQRYWKIENDKIEGVNIPGASRLLALWRVYRSRARRDLDNLDVFLGMEEHFLQGSLPVSAQVWSYAMTLYESKGYMEDELEGEFIFARNFQLSMTLPEYGMWCEVDNNLITVIRDNVEAGFCRAESLVNGVSQI